MALGTLRLRSQAMHTTPSRSLGEGGNGNLGLRRRFRALPVLASSLQYVTGKITIGHWAQVSKAFGDQEVRTFSGLSGDYNPVHLQSEYAVLPILSLLPP